LSLLGALLLVFLNCIRPQEFIPAVQNLRILDIAAGLAALGVLVEVATGKLKPVPTPQLRFLFAFIGWCVLCTLVKVGRQPLPALFAKLGVSAITMLVVAYSTSSFARFRAMASLIVCISLVLAVIAIRQGSSPLECITLIPDENDPSGSLSAGAPTGVACEYAHECAKELNDFTDDFVCEKVGLFGTFSIDHGRVRWRGTLADPNELSLFVGAAVSFVFAAHAASKRAARHVLLLGALAVTTILVIMTQSRSGLLVMGVILATYFVRRYGVKGLVIAAILGAPALAFGGREGEGAESSSLERIGALYEGMDFFRSSPIFGLGWGQFLENYFLTAHNSYVLSAAELGFPGLLLFSLLLYVSVKIPYAIGAHPPAGMDRRLIPYGTALFTSFFGILIGIFFLSYCYSTVLYMYFGLAGGLFLAAKRTAPEFEVRVSWMEIGILASGDAALLTAIFLYTRITGAP
jgi:hypothetical protein